MSFPTPSAISLNIVPARTGMAWVKQGIQTFAKQPLALGGLFFMFMALVSLVSMVPFVGGALGFGAVACGHGGFDGRHTSGQ